MVIYNDFDLDNGEMIVPPVLTFVFSNVRL